MLLSSHGVPSAAVVQSGAASAIAASRGGCDGSKSNRPQPAIAIRPATPQRTGPMLSGHGFGANQRLDVGGDALRAHRVDDERVRQLGREIALGGRELEV